MDGDEEVTWISLAQRIQAIARTGLTYAAGPYDVERYGELMAIAAGMIAGPERERIALADCLLAAEAGYATPNADVRAAVFEDDGVLLVRELEEGGWTLPGGWAEIGQSAAESVEREVREESGNVVKAVKGDLVLHARLASRRSPSWMSILSKCWLTLHLRVASSRAFSTSGRGQLQMRF
ncbi:MAG: hydrolase [Candidatus Solibacter sp.]|nr:hydrolase [Candidatus Solibacter sp.]